MNHFWKLKLSKTDSTDFILSDKTENCKFALILLQSIVNWYFGQILMCYKRVANRHSSQRFSLQGCPLYTVLVLKVRRKGEDAFVGKNLDAFATHACDFIYLMYITIVCQFSGSNTSRTPPPKKFVISYVNCFFRLTIYKGIFSPLLCQSLDAVR